MTKIYLRSWLDHLDGPNELSESLITGQRCIRLARVPLFQTMPLYTVNPMAGKEVTPSLPGQAS